LNYHNNEVTTPSRYSELTTIVEGRTKILVPSISLQSSVATKREPVFFNSAAELNRDISVIAYSSFLSTPYWHNGKNKNRKNGGYDVVMADSLCGTGVRGLRVAVESPEVNHVYFNDVNPQAIDVAKKSSFINHVQQKCHFSVNEACKFLLGGANESMPPPLDVYGEEKIARGRRFTIVDLDPFGSPANYVDCVSRSVEDGGLISITATDTAVLCGKYPDVCLRRYYGLPLRNTYSNEIALRLLISLVALTSCRLGIHIQPLFTHTNMHYLRIYVRVILSSKMANKVFENIGYLQHCFHCGNRTVSDSQSRAETCELCSAKFKNAGWLWTGKIYDKDFVRAMMTKTSQFSVNGNNEDTKLNPGNNENSNHKDRFENKERKWVERIPCRKESNLQGLFSKCIDEHDDIPYYFTSDEIASRLKIGPPSLATIIENLSKAGFRTSHTGLNPTAFKTDARINEILGFFRA
jgi:tRNA (guanine26-N2/guanine27-N2)-dimethyltransferase